MHLLHTADLHLRTDRPETVDALDTVLETARSRDVDLVTIGGDLFDRPEDANELRPELRDRFQDTPFEVLVIPGNHDAEAFNRNLEFGRQVDVLVDPPYESRTVDGTTVVGVPYTTEFTDELYQALYQQGQQDTTNILLIHCTLDIGFGASETGEEGQIEYCPVQLATLADLEFDYVLAGHIHSTFQRRALGDGRTFLYPGSPISHSRSETGPRNVALIDTDANSVESVSLDTYYYDYKQWTISPETVARTLEEIEAWVGRHAMNTCELEVVVDGFIDQPEQEFADALEEAASPARVTNQTRDVSQVYSHPLYERFARQLEQHDSAVSTDDVERLFIRTLGDLLAKGEIRT